MRRTSSWGILMPAILVAMSAAGAEILDSTLAGRVRLVEIQGRPAPAWVEMYEYNCFMTPWGEAAGGSARSGAPFERPLTYDGFYDFHGLPPGRYALYASKPPFFPRETAVAEVVVGLDQTVTQHVALATDYSMLIPQTWEWGETFAQTFKALGTSVTRAMFKVAGTQDNQPIVYEISIHQGMPGGAQVGASRTLLYGGGGPSGDLWVGWRAGEVPTVPGNTYHVRVRDANRSAPKTCALFTRFDEGVGYGDGRLFIDGLFTDHDIYGIVGADNDGTITTLARRYPGQPNDLTFWAEVWGQTFTAFGHGLAACDVFAAGGDRGWDIDVTFTVHDGGPTGAQIGPAKKMPSAFQAGGLYVGSVWAPGEAPLTPGNVYYIRMDAGPGMNAYRMPEADAYPGGTGYAGTSRRQSAQMFDLDMTILEYASPSDPPPPPEPPLDPAGNLLMNGDMELGTPGTGGHVPDHWTPWTTSGSPTFWYGDYGVAGSRAGRVIGGAINGTTYIAGLHQRVTGLDPARQYRLGGHVGKSQKSWPWFEGQIGYDPTGQTANPHASTVRYISPGHGREFFHDYAFEPFSPVNDSVTVFLRARATAAYQTYYVDFDDITLVEVRDDEGRGYLQTY